MSMVTKVLRTHQNTCSHCVFLQNIYISEFIFLCVGIFRVFRFSFMWWRRGACVLLGFRYKHTWLQSEEDGVLFLKFLVVDPTNLDVSDPVLSHLLTNGPGSPPASLWLRLLHLLWWRSGHKHATWMWWTRIVRAAVKCVWHVHIWTYQSILTAFNSGKLDVILS